MSVGGLLAMVPTAVSMSLFAHGSRDETDLFQRTFESARFSLLLLAPAIAGIFLFGGKVLLIFGRVYSDAGTRLLWMLALSALPLTVNYLFFSVRRVQQRMSVVIAGTVWVLMVTLGLSVFLLPKVGLFGAGIAWFTAQTSLALVILGRFALNR
jgi:O-antigen/teichoic acid export membrane protein